MADQPPTWLDGHLDADTSWAPDSDRSVDHVTTATDSLLADLPGDGHTRG